MPELPAFSKRTVSVSASASEPKKTKADEVVEEAQRAAAKEAGNGGGCKKGKQANILEHLVQILTRLCLQNSNDLREVMGVMFSCYLLPTEHVLSKASVVACKDYEQQVKDLKKAKEDYREELDKAMANSDSDMDDLPSPPAELAPPHLHIALTAINAALEARQ